MYFTTLLQHPNLKIFSEKKGGWKLEADSLCFLGLVHLKKKGKECCSNRFSGATLVGQQNPTNHFEGGSFFNYL